MVVLTNARRVGEDLAGVAADRRVQGTVMSALSPRRQSQRLTERTEKRINGGREPRSVVVERWVAASPSQVFAVLTSLPMHAVLDGSGMVLDTVGETDELRPDSEFVMRMRQGPFRYRSVNRVVEWEQNSLLTWETTGQWRGHTIVGGQWWRWELVSGQTAAVTTGPIPSGGCGTVVRHSYVWGRARAAWATVAVWGYPRRMEVGMRRTLDRLADHLSPKR